MKRTAILFSGTAYNFKYSIKSLMENFVIPNNADVFILSEHYNRIKKAPESSNNDYTSTQEAWDRKSTTITIDDTRTIPAEDKDFIKETFGDKLKGLHFIDTMPEYLTYLQGERGKMMACINKYRKRNNPKPFGGDVADTENGNVRCVINQYNHIKKCYELMEKYEEENNFKYDYVIRARIDFVAPEKIDIAQYYLNHDIHYLYNMGNFRKDKMEWADEFCWFCHISIAEKLFPALNRMGFIVDKKHQTVHVEQNNDFVFTPETQYSLLLYELNLPVVEVKINRSIKYTNGGDGNEYVNYMFSRERINLDYEYELVCRCPSDINEHLPTLKKYGEKCEHITELGTRYGNSTVAFMAARPKKFITYDVQWNTKIEYLKLIAKEGDINFEVKLENPQEIEPTDLLFIDTDHHVEQCSLELKLHAGRVKKYIIFHDTTFFWIKGQGHEEGGGLKYAIEPFLENHPEWQIAERFENNNGLLILQRI